MKEKTKRKFLQIAILVISISFIGIGILREEHIEVLSKAMRICLECIGIG